MGNRGRNSNDWGDTLREVMEGVSKRPRRIGAVYVDVLWDGLERLFGFWCSGIV